MIAGLLLALLFEAVISLIDPGFWLILAGLLAKEDRKNADLLHWELTGL